MKAESRYIASPPGSSFKSSLFVNEKFPAAWHYHPQYELTYILSSTGVRYVGDSIQHFSAGDFVMVGSNLPHSWKTVGLQQELVRAIIIQWDENLLGKNWLQTQEITHIRKLFERSSRGIQFGNSLAKQLRKQVLDIVNQSSFERILAFLKILHELANTQDYQVLAGPDYKKSISSKDNHRINIVYNYIRNHFEEEITLDQIRSLVTLSRGAFCRFFKKSFNKSFTYFLNEYRINVSCRLLIDSDLTVTQIGYKCGYNNMAHFYRQFKKFKMRTPDQYRKKYQDIPFL